MKTDSLMLILLVNISTGMFAQQKKESPPTKEETQEWISEKVRQYSFESSNGRTSNKYGISFKDDNLFIEQNTTLNTNLGTQQLHAIKKVPLKLVGSFSFKENSESYWLLINMKDGAKVIISEFDGFSPDYLAVTEIILPRNIDDENLRERLLKALNHLQEIYTGKPKKEPF